MRNKSTKKSLTALLMALVLGVTLAGCQTKPELSDQLPQEETSKKVFINTLSPMVIPDSTIPRFTDLVAEKYELNTDTVGWLKVPGTSIDDVVVWYPGDKNKYYYRLNFEKEYSRNGIFYADFRNTFGDGELSSLSANTVIYGHTMSADIDGVMFANLKYFTEEDFARETPYIYFSTREGDFAWEVFSVFYATIKLPYNRPDLSTQEFSEVLNECIKRSIYTYDTQVSATDKILTLSTCTYTAPGIGGLSYPNDYRYVIMAKQVDARDATKTEAVFQVNPEPKAP